MRERFSFKQFIVPDFKKKFCIMFFGILFMGFFLSFLIEVGWGTDPATFMNLNIAHAIGWTLGNWQLTMNVLMLVIVVAFKPSIIGFGTIFNMVLIGYTADFCCWLWAKNGVRDFIQGGTLGVKIAVFAIAIILFVIAAAVYMNAEMGLSPYDGCAKLFTIVLSKLPFFIGRIIFDMGVVLVGYIASRCSGGMQGSALGASVIGILLGPAITLVGKVLHERKI